MQQLQRIMGKGHTDSAQLGRDSILPPAERQRVITEELERFQANIPLLTERLFNGAPIRLAAAASKGKPATIVATSNPSEKLFGTFSSPHLVVGGGQVVQQPSGSTLWAALKRNGLYSLEPRLGRSVRLRGFVLSPTKPSKAELARAGKLLSEIGSMLEQVGLIVDSSRIQVVSSASGALSAASKAEAQAAVFFSTKGSADWYYAVKSACLTSPAPMLLHLASQWVDLSRSDHQRPALMNMVLQLCAKLGHTPYVLDRADRSCFQEAGDNAAAGPIVCGLDVCHLQDPSGGGMSHVTAGLQLRRLNGEVQHAWVAQGKIEGESIPPWIWETVVSKESCEGQDVIIHRDGRFTEVEKAFLEKHAIAIGAKGPFGLVEIVKYAGGTPRMYAGNKNALAGSYLVLSDTEALLASGDMRGQGTRNPLLIRVLHNGTNSGLSIEAAAEDVFRLSVLSYGSVYISPRLPVTTRTADKAAYFHASVGDKSTAAATTTKNCVQEEGPELVWHGRQQYWL
jgi:hypothetical protein